MHSAAAVKRCEVGPSLETREASDVELIHALRNGGTGAIGAYVERFRGVLLAYARQWRLFGTERTEVVHELLHDVALSVARGNGRVPDHPRAYLRTALRYKLGNRRRKQALVDRTAAEAFSPAEFRSHRAEEISSPSDTLYRLARYLSDRLSDADRRLLEVVAHRVLQREVAIGLGVSPTAARKRLERLRVRLIAEAIGYAATFRR